MLSAGWETGSQKRVRTGEQKIPKEAMPFAIWIDLLNHDIIPSEWSGCQTFTNLNVVQASQESSDAMSIQGLLASSQARVPFSTATATPPPPATMSSFPWGTAPPPVTTSFFSWATTPSLATTSFPWATALPPVTTSNTMSSLSWATLPSPTTSSLSWATPPPPTTSTLSWATPPPPTTSSLSWATPPPPAATTSSSLSWATTPPPTTSSLSWATAPPPAATTSSSLPWATAPPREVIDLTSDGDDHIGHGRGRSPNRAGLKKRSCSRSRGGSVQNPSRQRLHTITIILGIPDVHRNVNLHGRVNIETF